MKQEENRKREADSKRARGLSGQKAKSVQIILLCLLAFYCLNLPGGWAASAQASNIVLVNSDGDSSSSDLRHPTSDLHPPTSVLRQRTASLNAGEISGVQSAESIELQLFDDVRLVALRQKAQRGKNGALIWTGAAGPPVGTAAAGSVTQSSVARADLRNDPTGLTSAGPRALGPQSLVVLVVEDGKVYASIYTASSIFQLRPMPFGVTSRVSRVVGQEPKTRDPKPETHDAERGEAGDCLIRELCVLGSGPGVTSWFSTRDPRPVTRDPSEARIIDLVNVERSAQGLPVLRYNDRLAAAARSHAQEMAANDYNGHERRDGRKFWQSVFDSGYPVSKCGENVAAGLEDPEETFECLIASPGHRVNILDPDFTEVGVGHAVSPTGAFHHFWAQLFGAAEPPASIAAAN